MNNDNNAQDDTRDAHLLAALRHAPDRDAVPPRQVSERILEAARAAVRPARAARAPWWQRWSAWFAQPQVAAAFGTLAVASLLGVMWSTREPPVPEFVPSPPLADRVDREQQRAVAPAPAAAPRADAAKAEQSASGRVAASAAHSQSRAKVAAAPPPKPAPGRDAAARTEPRSRTAAEEPASTAAASTAATPNAAPPPAAAPAPQSADAAVPAAAAERRSANERDSQVLARQQGAAPSRDASPAAMSMPPAAKAQAVADPLGSVDRLLASRPQRMAWAGAGPQSAHEAAQAAWWARLKQGTAGAWQALPRLTSPRQPWLTLSMAGATVATIDLVGDSVLFCAAEGDVCWRAPITPAQREAWMAEVARW